jgi:DNA-binding NarL/FixJ family response regulator
VLPIIEQSPVTAESAQDKERLALLSDREREVLHGVASGKTTKLIASELNLSVKTVEAHRTSISKKLRINDIAGLTLFALRAGLLQA